MMYPRWQPGEFIAPATDIARRLLGSFLCRHTPEGTVVLRITETEAYGGTYRGKPDDASHAYRRQTDRNAAMFGNGGTAYIYFIYGMHYCFNVVTGRPGEAAAVLIRAGEICLGHALVTKRRQGISANHWTDGPGKICRALCITAEQNEHPLHRGALVLRHGPIRYNETVQRHPRIGIDYATYGKTFPWRYVLRKR